MTRNRLANLRTILKRKRLDAVLISYQPNIHYLSAFNGSFAYLLVTPTDAYLATGWIYLEQAKEQAPFYKIIEAKRGTSKWLSQLLIKLSINKLGFEKDHISFSAYLTLEQTASSNNVKLYPLNNAVEDLRQQKTENEIASIKKAADIADAAFVHLLDTNLIGMTELEISWEIESFMRQQGSQDLPFPVIVASGSNSALPHAQPTQRNICEGEPLLFDYGARVNGYASDFTRTICPGRTSKNFNDIYAIVLHAQLAVIEKTRDGMSCTEIDEIARQIIKDAGYGKNYGHGLGHGVGLEVHEPPYLTPHSKEIIREGMVFTVEPGIYLPGWGGVRLEDTVYIDCGRIKSLSRADK